MIPIIIVIAIVIALPIIAQKLHKEEPEVATASPNDMVIHADWECPECNTENDGDQAVCYQCQYMHPTIDVKDRPQRSSCCG